MKSIKKHIRILSMSLAFLALLLSMSGCLVLSVHPLYFETDLIFEPGLVGTWGEKSHEEDLEELWIFKQSGEKSYQLTIREKGVEGMFEAHLLKLDEHMFLDLYPEEPETGIDFYNMHLMPAHSFLRISLQGHVLQMDLFDLEWLQDNLEQNRVHIEHVRKDDGLVLTASTEKLQEFVLRHVEVAFTADEGVSLHRFW